MDRAATANRVTTTADRTRAISMRAMTLRILARWQVNSAIFAQDLQNAADQLGRNNPATPALNEAITAVNGAQSQALKGVILDPAEITKLKDVLGNAEVAVSRQLEVLVAKENARSPQEDSFPEGYVKQNAEYFKSLANQSPKQ